MSHSDENQDQDWDFSDSEEIHRNDSEERKPHQGKPSQTFTGPKRDAPLATPDPNAKKSALQELVEKDDYHDRRGYGDRGDRDDRRGGRRGGRGDRDRDFRGRGDRDDRRGGYRDYGDRGGRPRGDKEFSNYSSMFNLP